MTQGVTISAVVIAKNEETVIGRCIESLQWADEIVVVDAGSTDATPMLCEALGAKVYSSTWRGYGPQKNHALSLSTGEWVLSVDADEYVTDQLRDEILGVIEGTETAAAYDIPRLSSYCGREMRHGGWWPDRVLRLFRRGFAHFSDAIIHERLVVDGRVGHLKNHLCHEAYSDLSEVLDKVNRYSSLGAQQMAACGRRASVMTAFGHGLWTFVRGFVLKAGFLDGREGFLLAISNAEGTYYRYLKLVYPDKSP